MGSGESKEVKTARINKEKEEALAKIAKEQAKEKLDHEQKLKEMQIAKEQKDKELKKKQKNEAIKAMDQEIKNLDKKIDKNGKDLIETHGKIGKTQAALNDIESNIKSFPTDKDEKLKSYAIDIDYDACKKQFEDIDKNIQVTIDKTGQHGNGIVRFLTLTRKLIIATTITTIHSNQLNSKIELANDLLTRICEIKITIKSYFKNKPLEKYIPYLAKEGYIIVEQLKCNDDNEFNTKILGLIQKAWKEINKDIDNKDDNDDNAAYTPDNEKTGKQWLKEYHLDTLFYEKMVEEGWDDPADWKDITDDDLTSMGFRKGHINKFHRIKDKLQNDQSIPSGDKSMLKEICIKPWQWEKDQKDIATQTQITLKDAAPLMETFFTKMHNGIKYASHLIGYEVPINNKQIEAISKVQNDPPTITNTPIDNASNDNDIKDNDNDNTDFGIDDIDNPAEKQLSTDVLVDAFFDMRKEWIKGSSVEIYSDTDKKWFNGTIDNITNDNELHIKYNNDKIKQIIIKRNSAFVRPPIIKNDDLAVQCRTLTQASIISINIIDTMKDEFKVSTDALIIAQGIEGSCSQILKGQGTIRQSVLLTQAILQYKPANMTAEAKELWDTLDQGINLILTSARKMAEVSEAYFGFFLKFKESFNYYIEINKNIADVSLSVALGRLTKDIDAFTEYEQEYSVAVKALTTEADKVISDTVTKSIGDLNFQNDTDNRVDVRDKYLKTKRLYDKRALELDEQLSDMKQQRINLKAEQATLQFQIDNVKNSKELNQKYKDDYTKEKLELEKMII